MNAYNYDELYEKLAEILDIDRSEISNHFLINDSTVDSLGMLTLLSLIDELYSIDIGVNEILERKNISGLIELITEKRK